MIRIQIQIVRLSWYTWEFEESTMTQCLQPWSISCRKRGRICTTTLTRSWSELASVSTDDDDDRVIPDQKRWEFQPLYSPVIGKMRDGFWYVEVRTEERGRVESKTTAAGCRLQLRIYVLNWICASIVQRLRICFCLYLMRVVIDRRH